MTYHPQARERRQRLPAHRAARRAILRVVGGYDAGEQMRPIYRDVGCIFPLLPEQCWIDPDGTIEAVTYGLTTMAQMQSGIFVPAGCPIFSVQDEMILPLKTGRHECGHAFEAVCEDRLSKRNGWPIAQAIDYFRTIFWEARFGNAQYPAAVPVRWQDAQAAADAQTSGSMAQWMYYPFESIAENFRNVIAGYFEGEKTMNYGVTLTIDRIIDVRLAFERLMEDAGEDAVKTIEFSMPLTNGNATRIGADAFSLTEQERVTLGLVSGRAYSAQMKRIWLAGTETTFPDVLGSVYEDTNVPMGVTGRWKFLAAARRDFGGSGRYELAISTVTAKIIRAA